MATSPLTPAERTLRARLAAHTRWANADPVAGTQAARDAFRASFELKVDPDGILEPGERARRAEQARKAHYAKLSLAAAKAKRSAVSA